MKFYNFIFLQIKKIFMLFWNIHKNLNFDIETGLFSHDNHIVSILIQD